MGRDEDAVERIQAHFESSDHRGHLGEPTCVHSERNPVCGDEVRLELLVESDRIRQVRFEAKGCVISQAAASMLCEAVEGQPIQDVVNFPACDMLDLLKIPLTPMRQQCGLLAFKTLKTMVYAEKFSG